MFRFDRGKWRDPWGRMVDVPPCPVHKEEPCEPCPTCMMLGSVPHQPWCGGLTKADDANS